MSNRIEPPPGALPLKPAGRKARASVEAVLGPCRSVERIARRHRYDGLFKVRPAEGPALLFRWHGTADAGEAAEFALARRLFEAGVATPRPRLAPAARAGGGGRRCSAHCFVEHRPLAPLADELAGLASAVAGLHCALARHPDAGRWTARSRRRLERLQAVRGRLRAGTLFAGPRPAALRRLAARGDIDFLRPELPRQPLHGDLHAGNLFVGLADGAVRLVDFEDVHHSVLPLDFELALVLERQVFAREEDDVRAATLAQGFLEAYARAGGGGQAPLPGGPSLLRAVLALNLRSLCTLAALQEAGVPTPREEWRKFFRLLDRAEARAGAWEAIG